MLVYGMKPLYERLFYDKVFDAQIETCMSLINETWLPLCMPHYSITAETSLKPIVRF